MKWNVALYAVAFCVLAVTVVFACCVVNGCADNPPYLTKDGFLRPYSQWPLCDGGDQ